MDQTLTWIEQQYSTMCETLNTWANINSGTFHLDGLEKMSQCLQKAFSALSSSQQTFEIAPFEEYDHFGKKIYRPLGKALSFHLRPEASTRVLLVGHLDTVYGPDHPFQTARLITPEKIHGPGVADMKGGLLIMLYALMALEQSPLAKNIGWDILLNPDEEIGSPGSAPLLETFAKTAYIGLVFEPALDLQGTLAGARKGSGKFTLIAHGKAAHAGRSFTEGKNAIVGLSDAMIKIHQLNEKRKGVTINIGTVQGGSAVNVVPPVASCQIDIRLTEASDEAWVQNALSEIVEQKRNDDIHFELHGYFGRKPKTMNTATLKLYELLKEQGHRLSIPVEWEPCGGCCDGNNLSAAGLPVIDSLGIIGGNIHSEEEFALLPSLVDRTKLVYSLLLAVAKGSLAL